MAGYLKTYTGLHVDPLNVKPEDIELRDVAHALSLMCRGNGQVTHFYSVAQHCINAVAEARARGYDTRLQLVCLLHDASEAYMADLIRPIKQYLPKYSEIENAFLNAVFTKFGIGNITDEEWKLVKSVDDDILDYDLVELLMEPMPVSGYRTKTVPDLRQKDMSQVEEEYYCLANELLAKM